MIAFSAVRSPWAHPRQELALGPVRGLRKLGAALFGDVLEGTHVAARRGRVFAPDGLQHTLLTLFKEDPEVEFELALRRGAQLVAFGDSLAVLGMNIWKQSFAHRWSGRGVATEELVHVCRPCHLPGTRIPHPGPHSGEPLSFFELGQRPLAGAALADARDACFAANASASCGRTGRMLSPTSTRPLGRGRAHASP
jgi:hypothetical protein